ncbi:MAG: AAA family ATPase [Gemmatimonadota bacterium]
MQNPFEYGRELGPGELVDREAELAEVRTALLEGGKLFLIGPRRFGKTSLHNVAAFEARHEGAAVLRYNVEAFPRTSTLIATLIADTARVLSGPVERVAQTVIRLFQRLRPSVSYNPLDQTWNISLGLDTETEPVPHLAHALNSLEAAASEAGHPVGLILDEIQHLLIPGGTAAEGQLRAAVQEHRHVGYVFAGSDTRFFTAVTMDAGRPFYRLGAVRVLGPIPSPAFLSFLAEGFARLPVKVAPHALEAILDLSDHVPYNVQQLASYIWAVLAAEGNGALLTPVRVAELRDELARRLDPLYSAAWVALTSAQQAALQAVVHEAGSGVYRREVLRRYDLSASAMKKAVDALLDRNLVRREVRAGHDRLTLEDPLFGSWVRIVTRSSP